MTVGLVIFARFDSARLPGKALLAIDGRPLLGHVVDRARRISGGRPVIVATSERAVDDGIAAFAESERVRVFRGSTDDVAGRALACAEAFGLGWFARICGDRPFHDPGLADDLIDRAERENLDLATNAPGKTFPPGLTVEIVRTDALRRATKSALKADDREHVTQYFYRYPSEFRIGTLQADAPFPAGVSLVVDTPQDLARARWIASRVPRPVAAAGMGAIVALADAWQQRNGRPGA